MNDGATEDSILQSFLPQGKKTGPAKAGGDSPLCDEIDAAHTIRVLDLACASVITLV